MARWCQVMPSIDPSKCWDTSISSTTQRLDSGIADYQVHIRGGSIIPYQNALALKVTKSQDLVAAPTELLVLTNQINSPLEVTPSVYHAQAVGLVYLDDGTSARDIGRYDISAILNDDKTFTVQFTTINPLNNQASAGKASTVSAITFLWASTTGYKDIKTATLIDSDGKSIPLDAPQWDATTDTLRVSVSTAAQKDKSWTFWSIGKINLSN